MPQIERDAALDEDDCSTEPESAAVYGDLADVELPPGSFRLSTDAGHDWLERYSSSYCGYEREDSTKGNSLQPPTSNSNSQRFSVNLKTKVPLIGLSKKIQMATFVDPKWRSTATCNKPASGRMFTRQFGNSTTAHVGAEPASPLVSCMGRVRSESCRRRSSIRGEKQPPMAKEGSTKKTGFCKRVLDIFRSKKTQCKKTAPRSGSSRKNAAAVEALTEENAGPVIWRSVSVRRRSGEWVVEPGPPGLGGMTRFTSGRRSCSSLTGDDVNY